MALTADQILAADDLGLLKVAVKEWKGEVYIRVMSVGERDAYERMWIGKRETGVENFRTEYLARVLCDEKGELLFAGDRRAALATKSGAVMGRLFDAALKHNNMTEADVVELGKG
jgi:hypothetical protein